MRCRSPTRTSAVYPSLYLYLHSAMGSVAPTDNGPPPELLPRILCRVAFTNPRDFLNCLLVCRAWSSALSARERCLVKHRFSEIDDLERAGQIFRDDAREASLDTSAYAIWDQLDVAFLTAGHGFLSPMQLDLRDGVEPPKYYANAPQEEARWSALSADIDLLAGPLHVVSLASKNEFAKPDGSKGFVRRQYTGAMSCPLLMPPVPELDALDVLSDSTASIMLALRLRVSPHLRDYYRIKRISLADEEATTAYLIHLFQWLYDADMDEFCFENDEHRLLLSGLYQALKDNNIVELIDVDLPEGTHEHADAHGGWDGNLCFFVLCRREEPGRNVVGWMMFNSYLPLPYDLRHY
ncbi:uncharacterized protein EV422DRAFT_162907 [Fimicolochytrium jonesii]|uniref:uncharacterized protein n=1 Tax=Fimicolochytrium jonesii TaxID=1396493 RepID=UPI0022FE30A3|nr:uncharacterized protein EV422DRAFT_162907 [Fimicolochytrium jonesii]KAI8818725.1 hypothetical protein EV422DRAFT_162907 [Fimicolochytrium jonesii]